MYMPPYLMSRVVQERRRERYAERDRDRLTAQAGGRNPGAPSAWLPAVTAVLRARYSDRSPQPVNQFLSAR